MIDTAALIWGILIGATIIGTAIFMLALELRDIRKALITIEIRLGEIARWQQ